MLSHLWRTVDERLGQNTFSGDPHNGERWDKISDIGSDGLLATLAKPTISMVRNPYSRALSGYLWKIGERKEAEGTYIWNQFKNRFGYSDGDIPTFVSTLIVFLMKT